MHSRSRRWGAVSQPWVALRHPQSPFRRAVGAGPQGDRALLGPLRPRGANSVRERQGGFDATRPAFYGEAYGTLEGERRLP